MDYEKIRELIALVERNGLTELAVEEDGFSVSIKAETASGQVAAPVVVAPSAQVEVQPIEMIMGPAVESVPAPAEQAAPANHTEIRSPMIGVFYRKPSPDSPAFIEVGDEIEVGQTIGLIEAMKVFSEVPSEVAGHVVSVHAENGKLVQAGDLLAVVDTTQGNG